MQQFNEGNSNQLDEIESIREALNQTRTEMTRQRRRIEMRQLEVDAHIRRTNALWAVMLLTIAGFGTAIFYGFHTGALVVRFPSAQTFSSHDQGRLSSPEESWIPEIRVPRINRIEFPSERHLQYRSLHRR
jgi:uncharacterized membrane protein